MMHTTNAQNQAIPNLRLALLRGQHFPGVTSGQLLHEGQDISIGDYAHATKAVHNLLVAAGPDQVSVVTSKTVREWLAGEVVAPEDHRTFGVLSGIDSYLADFSRDVVSYQSNPQSDWSAPQGNLAAAYHIWKTLMQGVKSYLARRPSGRNHRQSSQSPSSTPRRSLAEELS